MIVGGAAPTVSPAGYTMGGGHSPISRTFGLGADNVLEIQVFFFPCIEQLTLIHSRYGTLHRH